MSQRGRIEPLKNGFIRLFGGLGICECLTLSHELGVVEGEEFLLEVFVVSVAVGSSLQHPDVVVDAFQRAGRERVVVPVEEASQRLRSIFSSCWTMATRTYVLMAIQI